MNDMRKLMETVEQLIEQLVTCPDCNGDGVIDGANPEDPMDDEWCNTCNGEGEVYSSNDKSYVKDEDQFPTEDIAMVGPVTIKHDRGEVSLNHGHGENIYLSQDEWSDFINGLDSYLRG
jgi:RecJ-like exonuclease